MPSPRYAAVMLCAPVVREGTDSFATPLPSRLELPNAVPPSRMFTLPVGVPVPFELTLALNTTLSLRRDGFTEELSTVLLVAFWTVSVKFCVALPEWFVADSSASNVPAAADVPLSVPVPSWLSRNPTPFGNCPVCVMLEAGNPVVVTVKEPAVPTRKLALSALVIAGACPTRSVK